MKKDIKYGIIGALIIYILTAVISFFTGFNPFIVYFTIVCIVGVTVVLLEFFS